MMTIKKTSLVTAALLVSVAVFGQKSKRTSANNYLQYGELDNAKEAIDPTITHEKTMNEAKTYFFRGQIYQAIYESARKGVGVGVEEAIKQYGEPKDKNTTTTASGTSEQWVYGDGKYLYVENGVVTALQNMGGGNFAYLHDNPLQVAFESFLKCKELDTKNFHTDMVLQYLNIEGQQFVNEGITRYNAKDYAGALQAFENTIQASNIPEIKRTDSLAIYYAGACAEQVGDLEKAEKYYREAMAIGYKGENALVRMQNMYAAAGNEEKSFEILQEGRKLYPNNQSLITNEVNVYLGRDQHAEAMKSLELALQGEPDNASLHFAYGFVNDRLAAKEIEANPDGNEAYKGYIAAAEKSYSKSVELDGSNFDAVYNLGALYFNQAVKMNEAANQIDDMKKFETARDAADVVFDKSLPILEKAYAINPDDKGVLISLKQLYYRKMAKDESFKTKYDEIMARMK